MPTQGALALLVVFIFTFVILLGYFGLGFPFTLFNY